MRIVSVRLSRKARRHRLRVVAQGVLSRAAREAGSPKLASSPAGLTRESILPGRMRRVSRDLRMGRRVKPGGVEV